MIESHGGNSTNQKSENLIQALQLKWKKLYVKCSFKNVIQKFKKKSKSHTSMISGFLRTISEKCFNKIVYIQFRYILIKSKLLLKFKVISVPK